MAGFGERGRHDDAADVVAPPVIAFEARGVAVGLLGPPRHRACHQVADSPQMWLGDGELVGLQVVGHGGLQGGVGGIPVQADRPFVVLCAVARRLLRRREGQSVDGLDVVIAHTSDGIPGWAFRASNSSYVKPRLIVGLGDGRCGGEQGTVDGASDVAFDAASCCDDWSSPG